MTPPHASPLIVCGLAGLSLALLVTWPLLLWRAAPPAERGAATVRLSLVLALWSGLWFGLAQSGVLARVEQRPPLFAFLPPTLVIGVVWLVRSRLGALLAAVPLASLVGLQAFRLPLELVMHAAAQEGVMPVQMTFGSVGGVCGWNYDIVTGATALVLWAVCRVRPVPRVVVLAWNVMGLVLLAIVMSVGVASTPLFARFGPEPARLNTWILFPPFVWLPAVLVGSALLGHLLVFRRLLAAPRA